MFILSLENLKRSNHPASAGWFEPILAREHLYRFVMILAEYYFKNAQKSLDCQLAVAGQEEIPAVLRRKETNWPMR